MNRKLIKTSLLVMTLAICLILKSSWNSNEASVGSSLQIQTEVKNILKHKIEIIKPNAKEELLDLNKIKFKLKALNQDLNEYKNLNYDQMSKLQIKRFNYLNLQKMFLTKKMIFKKIQSGAYEI